MFLTSLLLEVYLTYLNLLVNGLIPLLMLIPINTRIYMRMITTCQHLPGQQPAEVRHTQASLAIATGNHCDPSSLAISDIDIAVFILCHAVRWIPNVWEFTHTGGEQVSLHTLGVSRSVYTNRG